MTAINPDFAFVVASTSICSWWGSFNSGFLIRGNGLIAEHAGPAVVSDLEPPAVVKSLGGASMTAINEDTVKLWGSDGNVMGPGRWDLVTLRLFFLPTALL